MKGAAVEVDASKVRLSILGFVAFTFIGYFTIGLALAVLPVFIHQQLGYSAMVAGIVISLQYITTFFFRGYSGSIVDKKGPKPAVLLGMSGFALSGALLFVSYLLRDQHALSLAALVCTRLVTGFGEGLIGASPVNWAMLATGDEHTAKAISFNGIASYSALAIGAPCGVIMQRSLGLGSLGITIIAVGLLGLLYANSRTALKGDTNMERQPFLKVLKKVTPYGICLALGGLGFGSISTFITLYYSYLNWQGAVLSLSIFSILFIIGRLIFESFITTYGGLQTSMACLVVEALGLFILWQANTPYIAFAGAGITGLGFSLVFPALGVEAVKLVPASNRGAALGGYGLFIDLSLCITGPLIGFVAGSFGMSYIYAFSAAMVLIGFLLALAIRLRSKNRS